MKEKCGIYMMNNLDIFKILLEIIERKTKTFKAYDVDNHNKLIACISVNDTVTEEYKNYDIVSMRMHKNFVATYVRKVCKSNEK